MRKYPQTSSRHSLGFDLLEHRQLLHGGFFPASAAEIVVFTYGPTVDSGGVSGHDARPGGPDFSQQASGPAWAGPAGSMNNHDGDASDGGPSGLDASAAGSSSGGSWAENGGPSSPTASGPSTTAMPDSSPSVPPSDPLASGTTPGNYGSSTGGGVGAPGGDPAPATPSAMVPGISPPALPSSQSPSNDGPGGAAMSGRPDDAMPSPSMMFAAPAGLFTFTRGRSEPFEPGGTTSGPLNATGGPNGPGVQGLSSLASNVSTPSIGVGAGIQAVPSASNLPAQPATMPDSESPRGESPAAAVGASQWSDGRGAAPAGRLASTLGRSVLATTLSHSVMMPRGELDAEVSDRDASSLSPRGADLIAEALPFAGDSLEQSLNEFVRQLEAVDVAGLVNGGPAPVVVATLAVLGTAASAIVAREVVRRRSLRGRGVRMVDHLGRELALSFPELPRSWSEKR
jgi:hypothetical protein